MFSLCPSAFFLLFFYYEGTIVRASEVRMDFMLSGVLAIAVVVYLIYTLIYPEKF